jgi:F-type H+-transporting ATPase subunit delta
MSSSRVAKRYARALLELAERGQAEVWGAELEKLARTAGEPELMGRLTSPELSQEKRELAMEKIAAQLGLSFPLRSFAVVVARHGRIADIGAISQAYQGLVDDLLGRARATITFAAEPERTAVERVISGLEAIAGKTIIAAVRVDPALLGGVTAELGGRIYDGSLAAQLAEARRRLAG